MLIFTPYIGPLPFIILATGFYWAYDQQLKFMVLLNHPMDILFLKLQRCVNVHAASVVVKLIRAINDLVFGAAQLTTWSWFRSTTCFELKPFHNFPRMTHTIRLQLWSSQLIHCISSWLSWYRPYHRIDTSYSCYVCNVVIFIMFSSLTNHSLLHSLEVNDLINGIPY